jgi:hypothetical protein
MLIREIIDELIIQAKKAAPQQLARLVRRAMIAPFVEDLLEVDQPLWGGFWQGDVIAPGYTLPAVELALLRATRLDALWPEGTSVAEFLTDLRQAISDPNAGVWALAVAGEPCVVFASGSGQRPAIPGGRVALGGRQLATVVWYCAATERLHAGYRTLVTSLNFGGAVEQRRPEETGATHLKNVSDLELGQLGWLEQLLVQEETGGQSLATWLDTEILHIRHRMEKKSDS